MAYSQVTDLLLGDLRLSSKVDPQKAVDDAADEIDSVVGQLYELPLPGDLPTATQLLLKRMNNQLATGRLILQVDAGGEDNTLHAYGLSLVNSALGELNKVATGMVTLVGAVRLPGARGAQGPTTTNYDAYSGVDAFEALVGTRARVGAPNPWWRPGG